MLFISDTDLSVDLIVDSVLYEKIRVHTLLLILKGE